MRAPDRESYRKRRRADELRAKYEVSYEEALLYAAKNDLSYVVAVEELVKQAQRKAPKG